MIRDRILTAFEHDTLRVGTMLDPHMFQNLARFHDTISAAYFDLGDNCIRLKQYVGILHVDGLTIEVLPKIDRSGYGTDAVLWRTALLEMLVTTGILKADILTKAPQSVGETPLLDILLLQFISAVETLVREGLVKKYRSEQGNISTLKGKLLFAKHLNHNGIRPDQWFTDHTIYDRNHSLNGILRCTLDTLVSISPAALKNRLCALRLDFIDMPAYLPDADFIDSIRYDRRTERYREAIELAWLILRNLSPELRAGKNSIFALLFDMNALFERTVRSLLIKEAARQQGGISVGKETRRFWRRMFLQPDIFVKNDTHNIVVDTKWKIPANGSPAETDVRQVFTYGLYFNALKVVLLYPGSDQKGKIEAPFESMPALPDYSLSCATMYANLVTETGKLNADFAKVFFAEIFKEA